MKIAISYFYQIRFFKPNMIPISTAMWDPKWFHDFKSNNFSFIDKNGVINGLRSELFVPDKQYGCGTDLCKEKDKVTDIPNCKFMSEYYKKLKSTSVEHKIQELERICKEAQDKLGFKEEPIAVLIVFETVENMCSERKIIQKYFNENDIGCKELIYPIKENY